MTLMYLIIIFVGFGWLNHQINMMILLYFYANGFSETVFFVMQIVLIFFFFWKIGVKQINGWDSIFIIERFRFNITIVIKWLPLYYSHWKVFGGGIYLLFCSKMPKMTLFNFDVNWSVLRIRNGKVMSNIFFLITEFQSSKRGRWKESQHCVYLRWWHSEMRVCSPNRRQCRWWIIDSK